MPITNQTIKNQKIKYEESGSVGGFGAMGSTSLISQPKIKSKQRNESREVFIWNLSC